MATTISPQQRAMNFGAMTRQHIQTLGTITANPGEHVVFEVPKARLLQAINLMVEVDGEGSGTTLNTLLDVYDVLRRVSVNYNNGFSPITASGKDLAVLNMLRLNSNVMCATPMKADAHIFNTSLCKIYSTTGGGIDLQKNEGNYSCGLLDNGDIQFKFMLEIPLTLNERDPSGLILAQNSATLINVGIDINNTYGAGNAFNSVKITPEIVSFSVPNVDTAFPDLSVLKVVESRTEAFAGGGSNLIKLPIGQIYRKLIIYLEDKDGKPMTPDKITGNFELLLNTADIPYSINPQMMRFRTISQCGYELPDGYYALDLSYQGIPNLGGSRDYLDCETISTFELRFSTQDSGNITLITEKISRITASK